MLLQKPTRTSPSDAQTPSGALSFLARIPRFPWWPEALAAFLSLAGVLCGILAGFHPRQWQASGSDLKTLYASSLCFRQHLDPYSFANIAEVFRANQVVPPTSWYGHAPVYPPFTLALLTPITLVSMVHAVYLWLLLSGLAVAVAAFLLTRAAARMYGLTRPWRLLLLALFAASPFLSFGLEMCNVSPLVAALAIAAVAAPTIRPRLRLHWCPDWRPLALTLAILLKPHLALWVLLALFLSPRISPRDPDRRLAVHTSALTLAAILATGVWLAANHQLLPQLSAYRDMVHLELASGSMAPASHDRVAVAAQITSLDSLFAYWLSGPTLALVANSLLTLLALALLATPWRTSRYPTADPAAHLRLPLIAAWCAFGLLATYHRAHDGTLLLLLLPWLLARLRQRWFDPFAWTFFLLALLTAFGPTWETLDWLASQPHLSPLAHLILFRQAPLAALCLLLLLLAQLRQASRSPQLKPSLALNPRPLPAA